MWQPAAWSADVGREPRAAGPVVIWRDDAGLHALLDRCPHRGYPLSRGALADGALRCGYHGWRFAPDGRCVAVPGAASAAGARAATRWACVEREGVLWVNHDERADPATLPDVVTDAGPGAVRLRWSMTLEAGLDDVAENILDVPHTAFLHAGLFRTDSRRAPVRVDVTRTRDRVEARFVGEPVPRGVLGALLAPGGGVVTHVDRFVMPCVAQVEYALGSRLRLLATSFLREEGASRTRALHVVSLWSSPRALAWIAAPAFAPVAWWVLRQDARALRRQSRNLARHPGPFASTELDVIGPHARQMRERAAKGEAPLPDAAWSVTMG